MLNNDTLIIIPSFNEGNTILRIVNSLVGKYNYLVINDASFDMTDQILIDNKINHISNKTNLGLSETMRVGMVWALKQKYKFCIQFDADGQHEVETIEKMILPRKNFNLILASRFLNQNSDSNYHWNKKIVWKIFRIILKIKSGKTISDPTCGLRLFDKNFMALYIKNKKMRVEPSSLCYVIRNKNMSILEVETIVHERHHGVSKFSKTFHKIYYLLTEFFRIIFCC